MRRTDLGLLLLVLSFPGAACSSSGVRPVYPSFNAADRDVFGGWVKAVQVGPRRPAVEGELIAVTPDRMIVLTPKGIVELTKASTRRVTVTLYDPKTLIPNVGGGILLSLSHGFFAAATIPLWGAAGGVALRNANVSAQIVYPDADWNDLSRGARFPQGLPEGHDTSGLRLRGYENEDASLRR